MKKSIVVKTYIDPNINVGDSVVLIDGSGLSCIDSDEEIYIVFDYPELTGSDEELRNLKGVVTEVGITNYVLINGFNWGYVQDIVVKIGHSNFRTCSECVKKIQL